MSSTCCRVAAALVFVSRDIVVIFLAHEGTGEGGALHALEPLHVRKMRKRELANDNNKRRPLLTPVAKDMRALVRLLSVLSWEEEGGKKNCAAGWMIGYYSCIHPNPCFSTSYRVTTTPCLDSCTTHNEAQCNIPKAVPSQYSLKTFIF